MAGFTVVFFLLLAFSMAAAAISPVHADQNPPGIFVFGDSLSDVGNNNDLPYADHANYAHYGVDFPGGKPTGRFTNGYNCIDILAQYMGFKQSPPAFASIENTTDLLKGINFASGGSGIQVTCMEGTHKRCIPMKEQILNFKSVEQTLRLVLGRNASKELISKSIFTFTCGGNDLNNFFTDNFLNLFPPIDQYVANLTSTLGDYLKELYNLGGRKFAVLNAPAVGELPPSRVLDFLNVPNRLNSFSRKFNKAQYAMMEKLSSTLPGMKYSIGNSYTMILDVVNHPDKFGMKNVTSPCCGDVRLVIGIPPVAVTQCTPTASLCSNRNEYVFFDYMHPTQPVNEYACKLFYTGNQTYATPINLKQLVEYKSSRDDGATGNLGAIATV